MHLPTIAGVTGMGLVGAAVVAVQGLFPPDSLLIPLVQTFGTPAALVILWLAYGRKGRSLSPLELQRLEQLLNRQTEAITKALETQTADLERSHANSLTLLNTQIELHLEKHANRPERRREPRSG